MSQGNIWRDTARSEIHRTGSILTGRLVGNRPPPGSQGGIDSLGEHEGRLELTWTNKHLRLLAHEDGRYEWVSPSDYRVAEVRLLDEVDDRR